MSWFYDRFAISKSTTWLKYKYSFRSKEAYRDYQFVRLSHVFQIIFYTSAKKNKQSYLIRRSASVSRPHPGRCGTVGSAYRRFSHRSPWRFPPVNAQNAQQCAFWSSVKSAGGLECFLKEQHLHLTGAIVNDTKVGPSFLTPLRRISAISSSSNTSRSPHRAPLDRAFE